MDIDKPEDVPKANGAAESAALAPATSVEDKLKSVVALVEKSVKAKDTRLLIGRLLRQTASVRKQLTASNVKCFLQQMLPAELESRTFLCSHVEQAAASGMDADEATTSAQCEVSAVIPEVEFYAYLIVLIFLCDTNQYQLARSVADHAVTRLAQFNRRTLDVIAARIYFYYGLSYEQSADLSSIRSKLLALHRTAVLRHDAIGQETLMNLLLRNYLHYNLYDQAEKFRSKAQKADQFRSGQQYCRYLYYLGRIRTIQLEYTEAKDCLQQALRRAPSIAHGFRITVSKWLILVRLLLGEIPDRQEFAQPGMSAALQPYFELTQSVKAGDTLAFKQVTERFSSVFLADRTHNLITRLHQNVIRIGLRRMNLAYSRISLAEIAAKLHLVSAEDAEYIVAKAIRDGGIDAVIDHEGGFMASRERVDVYSTAEPQAAFHARIAFCLDLHNEAIKAMRFEPDAHRRKAESSEARQERLAAEQELAKALEEDDGEDF
ncbi:26S proteasome regulatory complex [Volvox carteri f. nagariensis]|uniref:26S proteasome regulatory complex n=1 Tax=Volvox carteri f. nagariensis TaxID=3068 RepID=D8TIA8_VOLCA|nr:26S proteasome regulatory complex [Volvox carteri f. nagariensis]EFJ52858.1 26S proteasome regulatory complex [Volvox carteri f. nagariensis]|eukprot:XP_002945863.1 26S proteasome regulatory complex [Volvox carteri f. nagariensis]